MGECRLHDNLSFVFALLSPFILPTMVCLSVVRGRCRNEIQEAIQEVNKSRFIMSPFIIILFLIWF